MLRSKYKTKCISYNNTVWPSFHAGYNLSAHVHGKTNAHTQSSIIPARNRGITNRNPVGGLNSNLNRQSLLNEVFQKDRPYRKLPAVDKTMHENEIIREENVKTRL